MKGMQGRSVFEIYLYFMVYYIAVESQCSEWQSKINNCERPMEEAIFKQKSEDLNADQRLNLTCRTWKHTHDCLDGLKLSCFNDSMAQENIEKSLTSKYKEYVLLCKSEDLQERNELLDCYKEYIPFTNWCIAMFDTQFSDLILEKQFEKACKVSDVLARCFNSIQDKIQKDCAAEGAHEYYRNYVNPVIVQVKGTISDHCKSHSEFLEYFSTNTAASIVFDKHSISEVCIVTLIILLQVMFVM